MDAATLSAEATLARFNAQQDRVARDMGYGDTVGALGVTKEALQPFSIFIKSKLDSIKKVAGHTPEELKLLETLEGLEPDTIALAVLNAALHSVAHGDSWTEAVQSVGTTIHGEAWAAGLLKHDDDLASKVDRVVRRKHGALKYRKQAARSIAARAGYKAERWPTQKTLSAGMILLGYMLEALPHLFLKVEENESGTNTKQWLTISEGALDIAEAAVEQALRGNAVFLPTAEAPKPWTGWFDGGYWDERSRFRQSVIRTRYKESVGVIRAAIKDGSMQPHLDALNHLQAVGWTINKRVLGVLKWAMSSHVAIAGLPPLTDLPMPDKSGYWDEMGADAKKLWKHHASKVKQRNRTFASQRVMSLLDQHTANMMAEHERFYTPMNCDWRGRVYGCTSFNFQRDDRVRALFLFADGQPIGEEGLYWLKVHVANCGDFDKIGKQPIEGRVKWVNDNLSRIEQMAAVPTKELWWTTADKPFLFLAACLELVSAMSASDPAGYVTRLPVSFDGSCSGLQHLSAMTRDEKTAAMVNLTPLPIPQDVYQTVADAVLTRIASEAGSANDAAQQGSSTALAKLWLGYGIDRKLVKRNVMTYSYSSKKFGMAQQLMDDLMRPLEFAVLAGEYEKHPFGEDDGRAAAKYLAGITFDAIERLVQKPAQAMAMLQKCARVMTQEGKPVTWKTPLGLPWVNRYHQPNRKEFSLWMHDKRITMKYADGHHSDIDKDRAANGVAPNFVHACDAAHLLMVSLACASEDITQVATVHDSFGCLASQAPRFRQIIREQFVKLYEENDVLAQVLAQSSHDLTVHNQQRLPETPSHGTLNLMEVLNADYAFA